MQASLTDNEGYVYQCKLHKRKKVNQNLIGYLVWTADRKNIYIFSKYVTTISIY